MSDPSLEAAYDLQSPDDARRLYKAWARTYDADFVDAQGYRIPQAVARAFVAAGGQGPVLDIGAGTGVMAWHLRRLGIGPVDGVDISPEMLAVAAEKRLYQGLFECDITQALPFADHAYGGVVSTGTFTLGHVGPGPLPELVRVTRPGGVICLSVRDSHYEAAGFQAALDALGRAIGDLHIAPERLYDDRADAGHRNDMANVVRFRRV
jgi:predicted TPR repeat methyltransferase